MKMDLNKFDEPTKRILDCKTIQDRFLIDQNLLVQFQTFVSPVLQTVKCNDPNKFESTEEIDIRVKKLNNLDERFKSFKKNLKKRSQSTNKQCEFHPKTTQTVSDLLNSFLERELPTVDIESIVKCDETVIQQHANNLEKISKFMSTFEACNQSTLPAAEVVNDTITLLREIDSDIDYLNESEAMYDGLSNDASENPYEKEIEQLTNNLYIQ